MATQNIEGTTTLEELMVSSLAMADTLAKLLIEKGLVTEREFTSRRSAERANYQAILQKMRRRNEEAATENLATTRTRKRLRELVKNSIRNAREGKLSPKKLLLLIESLILIPNFLRSFCHSVLIFIWGIVIAFIVNGSAVFDFLTTEWVWVVLGLIILWICLFYLAGSSRQIRNDNFIAITETKLPKQPDDEWKRLQEQGMGLVRELRQKKKRKLI